jgi:hypothetical protein
MLFGASTSTDIQSNAHVTKSATPVNSCIDFSVALDKDDNDELENLENAQDTAATPQPMDASQSINMQGDNEVMYPQDGMTREGSQESEQRELGEYDDDDDEQEDQDDDQAYDEDDVEAEESADDYDELDSDEEFPTEAAASHVSAEDTSVQAANNIDQPFQHQTEVSQGSQPERNVQSSTDSQVSAEDSASSEIDDATAPAEMSTATHSASVPDTEYNSAQAAMDTST